ncbi:MAG: hypothetical protein JXP34_28710 [Planctomycetes bacterium]|nr:hypothetical protein [Planctomycetota bacterium]
MVAFFDELMAGWGRFLEREPWASVACEAVFSIEDEASGEIHYAAVLGSAGTEFGLALARGTAGLRVLGGLVEEDIDSPEASLAGGMLSIMVHEGDFPRPYRKFLRDAIGPRKSLRGLPLIFAVEPGGTPRTPREEEVALLARAVGAVADLVGRGDLKPRRFRSGNAMPCIVLRRGGGIEQKEVTPVFDRGHFAEADVPEERLAAIRALPRMARTMLVSCSPAPICTPEGQLRMFAAMDAASEFLFGASAVTAGDIDGAAAKLLETFEEMDGLPSEIRTDSRFFYEGLKSILARLRIRAVCVAEIPELVELRAGLAQFLEDRGKIGGGRGGKKK